MKARVATRADVDGVTETLWRAFAEDPLWRWAFTDHDKLKPWWRMYVESALRYPWVWVLGDYAAASVWIPPSGVELTVEEERRVGPLLSDLVGERSPEVLELLERFEGAHPRSEPHYYLTLLGTDPSHAGRGLGTQLLTRNLERIDAEGASAYLESSNPANDARYERLGFVRRGEFSTPDDEHTVTTMWRHARGPRPRGLSQVP